jgi:DNA ligase-1
MNILKPKVYNGFDPTGYWMAEKLDGVRAEWDGLGSYMSKADKMYHVPFELRDDRMPNFPLSGEWWLGRGRFQETVSIVRNQRMDMDEWGQLKFMVFELPTIEGYIFEERQNLLHERTQAYPDFLKIIPWFECQSPYHFDEFYDNILDEGGEGVVLSAPESLYEFKRSSNQWKRTPTFMDEAVVTGHTEGTGKHEGKCGALLVIHKDGRTFKVGTGLSDVERADPPPYGSVITYSYKGLTNAGKPRHPAYLTVRDYE